MPDDADYIRELLKQDAKEIARRFDRHGDTGPARSQHRPRPNTRFLDKLLNDSKQSNENADRQEHDVYPKRPVESDSTRNPRGSRSPARYESRYNHTSSSARTGSRGNRPHRSIHDPGSESGRSDEKKVGMHRTARDRDDLAADAAPPTTQPDEPRRSEPGTGAQKWPDKRIRRRSRSPARQRSHVGDRSKAA